MTSILHAELREKFASIIRKPFATTIIAIFAILSSDHALGQCSPLVPSFVADLSGHPDSNWISPAVSRYENCCGTNFPDQCISFTITLDSSAVGILFSVYSG